MGRQYCQLSAEERGAVEAWLRSGDTRTAIAAKLQRSPSTITREIHRNGIRPPGRPWGKPPLDYEATRASARARQRQRRPRRERKLREDSALRHTVQARLLQGWSPQQIAVTLRREHPSDPAWHVSHQTIYTAIYAMPRGGLKRTLTRWLRRQRMHRKPQSAAPERRGRLPNLPSIHTRPVEVEERILPGHWEGDLIIGAHNQSAVGTLVERSTLWVMLVKLDSARAEEVLEGYSRSFKALPIEVRKTLTYDQGKEMALHRRLSRRTGLNIYFADPHSPWQRGIGENINGLLRQYLPKRRDLSVFSQTLLNQIADSINTRPRKTLNWQTPQQVFYEKCNWPVPAWKPMGPTLTRMLLHL
jgi:IS30 family transposase